MLKLNIYLNRTSTEWNKMFIYKFNCQAFSKKYIKREKLITPNFLSFVYFLGHLYYILCFFLSAFEQDFNIDFYMSKYLDNLEQ